MSTDEKDKKPAVEDARLQLLADIRDRLAEINKKLQEAINMK